MTGVLGIEFHQVALGPGIVNGVTTAALYGVIAVALVLSFRMSRTVACARQRASKGDYAGRLMPV